MQQKCTGNLIVENYNCLYMAPSNILHQALVSHSTRQREGFCFDCVCAVSRCCIPLPGEICSRMRSDESQQGGQTANNRDFSRLRKKINLLSNISQSTLEEEEDKRRKKLDYKPDKHYIIMTNFQQL